MVLSNKWASVSRTSKNTKEPILLYILHNYTSGTASGTASPKLILLAKSWKHWYAPEAS
jgi:hypothetical protein